MAIVAACSGGDRRATTPTSAPLVTATAPAMHGFPAAIYPPSVPATGTNGVLTQCPNPAGVTPVPTSARPAAVRAAQQLDAVNLDADLHNSDRSFWPQVEAMWAKSDRSGSGTVVVSVGPFGTREWGFVVAACGQQLASQTLVVALGPPEAVQGARSCLACVGHFFFIARGGKPLLYLVY
jgi:hypothetical protein